METTTSITTDAAQDAAITLTRVLDAPRSLVWQVWTEAAHVKQWWGPHDFTVPVYEADLRPGGTLRYEMRGPDGSVFPATGTFEEVVPQERIVTTGIVEIDGQFAFEARTTVTFADLGAKTTVTVVQTYSNVTPAGGGALAGAQTGWSQQFEKLDAYLAATPQSETAREPDLTLTRIFDAPRALLWKVWTEPEHLKKWWGPHGCVATVFDVDLRPGGAMRIEMRVPNGSVIPAWGTIEDVVPHERLVTIGVVEMDGKIAFETRRTVTFEDAGAKTKVTVLQSYSKVTPEAASRMAGAEAGWTEAFEKLDAYLEKTVRE